MVNDCIFCKIAAGSIPARLAYQDDQLVAFYDLNPQAPTHILVIPRRHLPGLAEAEPGDQALLGHLLLVTRRIAEQEGIAASGFRVVINTHADAGQSVPHLHAHILGGRRLGWPPG
ncbi:MAG: histidine triad nucleotide-binding protein [Armatimonadetes bacterium]|nr:histidine triad nucleotide-binding protein [Armatimonadota bacterium]